MQNSAFMSIHSTLQDCQGSPAGLCRGDCVESTPARWLEITSQVETKTLNLKVLWHAGGEQHDLIIIRSRGRCGGGARKEDSSSGYRHAAKTVSEIFNLSPAKILSQLRGFAHNTRSIFQSCGNCNKDSADGSVTSEWSRTKPRLWPLRNRCW